MKKKKALSHKNSTLQIFKIHSLNIRFFFWSFICLTQFEGGLRLHTDTH